MAMMKVVLMNASWYLFLGVLIAFGSSSSFGGDVSLCTQINEICRFASTSNQGDREAIETRLLDLLSENADPQSRGLVYAAIANVYGGALAHHAEDAVRFAREALRNQLSVTDECDMYLCLAKAIEAQVRHKQASDADARKEQVIPLIQGLSFVLDHLRINKRLSPPAVGKYDVNPVDPQYEEVVRQHAIQILIREDILQQNRLLAYRDDFSQRVLQLYGAASVKEPAFARIVHEAVGSAGKVEKVLLQLDAVAEKLGKSR